MAKKTKEMAVIESPMNWEAMKEQATMLVKSGMIPVSINTPEKAIAIAITSKELGIGMMEGFRSINVIQGKPTISPQLMLALANRTGKLENIKIDATDERCVVEVTRKGRDPHTEEFGVKEATALGLMGRDNYNKQRATMFKWRALAANLRVTFPDVMLGFYTPEEMGAEVKVTDNEEMEIVAGSEMVNTGIRVPAGYWDLPTPEEKQARIGDGNKAQKTPKGWFIFSPADKVSEFVETMKPIEESPYASPAEILELFRQVKEKNIPIDDFKSMLKKEFDIDESAKIKKTDCDKIITWIIRAAQDVVEDQTK